VARTQENVILHDATQEGHFTQLLYIINQRPKSVLCAPLINQGQLTGILYLENNLTTGAFTPKRLEVLNLLSSQIAISIENARLYTSITRFLPSEFLSLLDKKNIIDVQLGDQVEKEMSIFFADIRDFTSSSEKMTPQENFDFINDYLSKMAPIIGQHHGFIDKYIGDAIMALFPGSADEAVSASIAMLKELVTYNQERKKSGLEPIAIGIGLNTGLLMLGTVGDENRMDGTVISDAVNLAFRIEGMTKMYGAALLISEETYMYLNNVSQYAIRTIDRVKVKGKSKPITVYEVFDADAPHLFDLKMKTRHDFEIGLTHYRKKVFTTAILCFEQVIHIHPDDKAAHIYLNRCQHWQKVGVPDDWEGVEALHSK
jgi:class 3 adenylate cyclase